MQENVYLRMKDKLHVKHNQSVKLQDISFISTSTISLKSELQHLLVYEITKEDKNIVVIDCFIILEFLRTRYPHLAFQFLGAEQTVLHIQKNPRKPFLLLVALVWFLLFIGTAMTIMNFHYDVSMHEVQQKLHFLLTGKQVESPLWLQIPYSLGLGVGMLLFFNKWFKKRFNEEPSPMEVELFSYQENLHHYLRKNENLLYDPKYTHK